ncbi:MAG: tRNA uridine-5-carboxymethylaminomethyl(34) synthesis GTPase MnmE [Treponema sp.]|jgi:tRNA modification GTPase|nr:tRNA uridine-5-carboxymethylaminomethyl(34) synthesis GTPase MnmE [Treponema sp.]
MDNAGASYGDDSPIAAFATAPSGGALSLIRCSGKGAPELAASVFSAPEKLKNAQGNTVVHGWIVATQGQETGQRKIDEVLVSVFRAPKSYTGEDSLDISCHGGGAAGKGVMTALRAAGFRDALPGEYTFRAFMNGKLDLTRCESVLELVSAKTDKARAHAVGRLSGVLEDEINAVKQMLVKILCGVEIFLDYSDDEVSADEDEIAGRFPGQQLAREVLVRLRQLAQSWRRERIYQEGILTVIAGRPNAGKSSLFNLLLKEERSIVTEIPGTTRDWIEAWVSIEGIPIRLADTAGLRESLDPVEKIGVERSRDLLETADVVLYLIDGGVGLTDEDRAFIAGNRPPSKQLLIIWNKSDIAPPPLTFPAAAKSPIGVSAKTGGGMAELTQAIAEAAGAQTGTTATTIVGNDSAALGSQRQKNLVDAAIAALEEALNLAEREEALDLIAPLLREAVNSLGEITGEVSTDDILEEMFSKFCVGK